MAHAQRRDPIETPQPEPGLKPKPLPKRSAFFDKKVLKSPPIRHLGDRTGFGLSAFEFALAGAATILTRQAHRLVLIVSKRKLLQAAGRAWTARNQSAIDLALERLTKPMDNFGPVLRSAMKASNKLRLVVNQDWLPKRMFDRVPWPPPARSTTLILYLFLFGADVRPKSTTKIARSRLYDLLGFRQERPTHRARDLKRALAGVNVHLAKLGRPISFKMEEHGDDYVRFTSDEIDDWASAEPEDDFLALTQVHVDEYADDFEREENGV